MKWKIVIFSGFDYVHFGDWNHYKMGNIQIDWNLISILHYSIIPRSQPNHTLNIYGGIVEDCVLELYFFEESVYRKFYLFFPANKIRTFPFHFHLLIDFPQRRIGKRELVRLAINSPDLSLRDGKIDVFK